MVAIRDAKDNLIVRDNEVDGITAAHVTADLPAGVYTVAAAGSGAGNYDLVSRFVRARDTGLHVRPGAGSEWRLHPTPGRAQLHRS